MQLLSLILLAIVGGAFAGETEPELPIHDSPQWEQTLERVIPSVVALRVTSTRDFDTQNARSSSGTGFVVDAEEGLILTNRHLVQAGPVLAEAVLYNHEEVALEPVYRDPVHDFGLFRFDPEDVRFMELEPLELAPEAARVGMEIRVIGNDAGEKISILDGTLARLDRNAPNYGRDSYNDFNTFYLQAASNTSGGSSGSPVVDVDGHVVALNAGGRTGAASSFYLPLDRVVRAVEKIREGEPVPRGTLQTVFVHRPFDEVRRLGLQEETEDAVRSAFPGGTGMLVVTQLVPGGPGYDHLQPGDVLVRLGGELVDGFPALSAHLDDHVGDEIQIEVQRGGEPVQATMRVDDLHALSPDAYLEVSRGVLHEVSYQQARNHAVPVGGVYVASAGYMLGSAGMRSRNIITEIDGDPVGTLDAVQEVLEGKADGERFRVRYHHIREPRHSRVAVVTMDRRWFPMQRCHRDDEAGVWPCEAAAPPPDPSPVEQREASPLTGDDRVTRALAPSLVTVEFNVPQPTAGMRDVRFVGTGLVVDDEQGLVVVDRDTVPVALGDMNIVFGGELRVPGELVFLHPVHNLAVVSYEPESIGETEVQAAVLRDRPLRSGQRVWQVGVNRSYRVVSSDTRVESVQPLRLGRASTPRFRDSNVEGVRIRQAAPSIGGVLADRRGRVLATWASFVDQSSNDRTFYGLPVSFLLPVIEPLRNGEAVAYRTLGAEVTPVALVEARERGLSADWGARIRQHDSDARLLQVARLAGATPARAKLREGDFILAIDDQPVTRMTELERATLAERVRLTVLRNAEELELEVETVALDGRGVERVVNWAGLVVHEPHWDVAAQQGLAPEGVYVSWMWYGSPAVRYGIRPTWRIVEVDGQPIDDLDAFLEAVRDQVDGQPVRLRAASLNGRHHVATLKLDQRYWPTQLLEWGDNGWVRSYVGPTAARAAKEAEVP